jgi:hypothetical protein
MRDITACISDELYPHARLCAARRDLTVSARVRKFFESLRELPHSYYRNADPYAKQDTPNKVPHPPFYR